MNTAPEILKHNFAGLIEQWEKIENSDKGIDRGRGLAWLATALRAAVKLEFSTIPPYLCALWSIRDQSSQAASTLRHIVQEEMLHMGLACNMLVALGEEFAPGISDPDFAPRYPCELAGGVHAGLVVELEGLSEHSLEGFLAIELPAMTIDNAIKQLQQEEIDEPAPSGHLTIGEFYDLVEHVFTVLQPALHLDRQITGPLAWFPVTTLSDVKNAISLIRHQGEGSGKSPLEYEQKNDSDIELSHFFRFLELKVCRKIVYLKDKGLWGFGERMEWPECYPMAAVPSGGYLPGKEAVPQRVIDLCAEFNANYKLMLHHLNEVWEKGDQGELVHAIEAMFSLKGVAQELMKIPMANNPGQSYGPDFRL